MPPTMGYVYTPPPVSGELVEGPKAPSLGYVYTPPPVSGELVEGPTAPPTLGYVYKPEIAICPPQENLGVVLPHGMLQLNSASDLWGMDVVGDNGEPMGVVVYKAVASGFKLDFDTMELTANGKKIDRDMELWAQGIKEDTKIEIGGTTTYSTGLLTGVPKPTYSTGAIIPEEYR